MKHYRSSIPKAAHERVVATFLTGPQKYMTRCTLNGELVGIRFFHKTGDLESERPLKNGRLHGNLYFFDTQGQVISAEPFFNGLAHGVAKQFYDDRLIGTYTMKHGTGLDLWRCLDPNEGFPHLSEARYLKDGKWHGFEWVWMGRNSLHLERHFSSDLQHGIERWWNSSGKMRRGYPRYWREGKQVTTRQYLSACAKDPTLPLFREEDNGPQRKFPPEVAMHCV
jgi:hypothetical protein